ncbi:hypothetical protein PACTADRAFT_49579 [Pachysolen tannophilus NRRL Y-2460]|uniref:Zn(2)-C6 fungal-type domain-containing protein n=1 Tax=Pachysolen tannophilus NRRL Y-2460 TaxID=669874 RepID=A0A1E4TWM1_PACTA|nr:hypothetical protein PACTADRAFT_49579 [Pachysolen tannophilus NRRL Y-2460]
MEINHNSQESIDIVPIKVLGRNHLACSRCRAHKIKCDGKKPQCETCMNLNETCLYEEKDRKVVVMQSQIMRLQNRVKFLEQSAENMKKSEVSNSFAINHHRATVVPTAFPNKQQLNQDSSSSKDFDFMEIKVDPESVIHQERENHYFSHLNQHHPNIQSLLFREKDSFKEASEAKSISNAYEGYRINFANDLRKGKNKMEHYSCDEDILPSGNENSQKTNTVRNQISSLGTGAHELYQALLDDKSSFYGNNGFQDIDDISKNSEIYLNEKNFIYPFTGTIVLPEKSFAMQLVSLAIDRTKMLFYLYDETVFKSKVDVLYQDMKTQDPKFLCKLLATLAIGEQFYFAKLTNQDTNVFLGGYRNGMNSGTPGLKFFKLAIQLFQYNQFGTSLSDIQSCILLSYNFLALNKIKDAHLHSKIAIELSLIKGLHRKYDCAINSIQEEEREKRKRVWWTAFCVNSLIIMKLNIPSAIDLTETDVELPNENYIDLQDGFEIGSLNALVHIFKYVNRVMHNVSNPLMRSLENTVSPDEDLILKQKIDAIVILLRQLDNGPGKMFKEIFDKAGNDFYINAPLRNRTAINVALFYNQVILILTRPLVYSYLMGMIPHSEEVLNATKFAFQSACNNVDYLWYLRENNFLSTFGFQDSQFCFSALLILIVANSVNFSFPQMSKGVELITFMAKCGGPVARIHLSKIISLEKHLIDLGSKPISGIELSSMINYEMPQELRTNITDDQSSPEKKESMIIIKTEEIQDKDDDNEIAASNFRNFSFKEKIPKTSNSLSINIPFTRNFFADYPNADQQTSDSIKNSTTFPLSQSSKFDSRFSLGHSRSFSESVLPQATSSAHPTKFQQASFAQSPNIPTELLNKSNASPSLLFNSHDFFQQWSGLTSENSLFSFPGTQNLFNDSNPNFQFPNTCNADSYDSQVSITHENTTNSSNRSSDSNFDISSLTKGVTEKQ